MKTTYKFKMPSLKELLAGECPKEYQNNMKIILSQTTISNIFGELFIILSGNGIVLVRLKDMELVDGYSMLTLLDQETDLIHVISHSIYDVVQKFTLIKLNNVLTLANKM